MSDSLRFASSAPAAPTVVQRAWGGLVGAVAGITEAETRVARRGFTVERPEVVERLETIGSYFVWGYNLALRSSALSTLAGSLAQRSGPYIGFAYEGAAMGLAVTDWLTPGRHLFDAYLAGPADAHEYMTWIGLGWALARLPVAPLRVLMRRRSLNRWLALDGWGFHEGYFHWPQSVSRQRRPRTLVGDAGRVFDQGLGRSLWFVRGAEVDAVATGIAAFEADRHADLWAGAGLAAAYAGGIEPRAWPMLRNAAGAHASAVAQGVVFAAQARKRAGNPAAHTEIACAELLGRAADAAADIALETLPTGDDLAAYQRWRLAIQQRCAGSAASISLFTR